MLDVNLLRPDKGGDPDVVRESERRRYRKPEGVDDVLTLDLEWRDARHELDRIGGEFNKANKEVALLMKAGKKDEAAPLMEIVKEIDERRKACAEREKEAEAKMTTALLKLGNIVHDSVPIDDNEDNNKVERVWGEKRMEENLPNHVDLIAMLDIADTEQGTEVAGGRGYYLKGAGALLNQALINYALAFLSSRGHTPLATPFFMRQDRMAECAQLADFDEQLYKVTGEGEDKYLIATSEQTCCSYLRKRWLNTNQLPIRLAGYSTCFRKEVGSHGRDTLGIFRVHQFEKVEQFVAVSGEGDASWKEMDRMIGNSEAFYQSLNIPYQVVNIVSGALNDAAAKKFDLEAWFPSSRTFRELVSCSNCLDYQSRRLEIREGAPKKGPEKVKAYVHLLNSTLTATERTLCCVIENWQTPEGLVVPPALRPWMNGIEFIPFVRKLDKKGKLVDVTPAPAPLFPSYDVTAGAEPTAYVNAGPCAVSKAIQQIVKSTGAAVKIEPAAMCPEEIKAETDNATPVFSQGDLVLSAPLAILRHIVKSNRVGAGLYPAGAAEQARVEALIESAAAGVEAIVAKIEKALASSTSGFLVGSSASLADVYLAAVCESVSGGSDAFNEWRTKSGAL
ncbi:Aminoacyl-tRNA synthetase, class II [Ostreococcus tauri]|uniref:serine--tRNA ligase n=1 Tax=Ostreococcus tauri TaxID=70448 RepID=A0A090M8L7_OSTTA|nr:Aminoacyl-tRNA synthetase, class II [Ostreococcus tauri]CEG01469.1 Aminoacyl-tRNA synthetase, class II [Ostreococcus tauri]|eukprot:XP_022840974.1 Aminoacyl-tRNA synthetase, class II [Ostreococcus tauri]